MKRRIFFAIALSFCLSFVGALGARAQTTDAEAATSLVRQALLAASDGQEGERFGQGVALDGDMLVVGASQATVNGNERQGAAYVFQKTGAFWTDAVQVAKLTASDGDGFDYFGWGVAVQGYTIVVGGYYGTKAYVFVKPENGWTDMTETAALSASDGTVDDSFGRSVAIENDTIVVGAPFKDDSKGGVYVYLKPNDGWADMDETARLSATNLHSDEQLGVSVDISGNTIVAGAFGNAFVYVKPNGGWEHATQTARLDATSDSAMQSFGRAVAIHENTVAVGAPGADGYFGTAYVFVKPNGGWSNMTETAQLETADSGAGSLFGSALAMDNSTIVVGAPGYSSGLYHRGGVYIFRKHQGGWKNSRKSAELRGSDKTSGEFGTSVDWSHGAVLVGAPMDTVGKKAARGSAALFANAPAKPTLVAPADKQTLDTARVLLQWNRVPGASSYHIIVKQGSAKGTIVVDAITTSAVNFKTPKLPKGKKYYWYVFACKDAGCNSSTPRTFKIAP